MNANELPVDQAESSSESADGGALSGAEPAPQSPAASSGARTTQIGSGVPLSANIGHNTTSSV